MKDNHSRTQTQWMGQNKHPGYINHQHKTLRYSSYYQNNPLHRQLHKNSSLANYELTKQNMNNNQQKNQYQKSRYVHSHHQQNRPKSLQILSSVTTIEGNIKKTMLSKALKGYELAMATQRQKNQMLKDKKQNKLTQKKNHPLDECRISNKSNGIVEYYAANTTEGIVRNYNQDRVSIILNIIKPDRRKNQRWPHCSFFGVFDGHGGSSCSDFLRDHLHQYIIRSNQFPHNAKKAIVEGFKKAQSDFLQMCQKKQIQKSGSCALITLIVGNMCYIANVGDSRAVLSLKRGRQVAQLTRDHKPVDQSQQRRILKNGGKIFQTQCILEFVDQVKQNQVITGPLRVFPGRLSVSRTIGDIQAKWTKYGGVPGVIISEPEITYFMVDMDNDFILLGSDGIFDKMQSSQVVRSAWQKGGQMNCHKFGGCAIKSILQQSISLGSSDNLSLIIIGLRVPLIQSKSVCQLHTHSISLLR